MFGYVTPLKSELKFKEFEYFRSYYCGLCNEIKREYGNIPRFCLNYDLTFIGFLLDGLYSNPLIFDSIKCLRHPGKNIIITKPKTQATCESAVGDSDPPPSRAHLVVEPRD